MSVEETQKISRYDGLLFDLLSFMLMNLIDFSFIEEKWRVYVK